MSQRTPNVIQITPETMLVSALAKRVLAHKFDHGHALVVSGGSGRTGAARLAARAALRVGAGLVTLAVPPHAVPEAAAHLTSVMLVPIADAADLGVVLSDSRIGALCLGPAMGLGARESALVETALAMQRPTVLDADALTLVARSPALVTGVHRACVLTPHEGEFARLFPDLAAPSQNADDLLVERVRAAADRVQATVLLKGARTVVATADGKVAVHDATGVRAAPWLATAGAGDVLAGLIAGLLARRFDPFDAACHAVFLHVEAARLFGPGLIAEDLPELIPNVLRQLGV